MVMVKEHQPHRGDLVQVGEFEVLAGGVYYLQPADLSGVDLLVPLTRETPFPLDGYRTTPIYLRDFGGVPDSWELVLKQNVIGNLRRGKRLLAFCGAGHGRTGTFLASLIALLESEKETPDPIAAVRQRYCMEAVETVSQGEAVFALREQPLPSKYRLTLILDNPRH